MFTTPHTSLPNMLIETSPLSNQVIVHLTTTTQDLEAQKMPQAIKDVLVLLHIIDSKTGKVITGCGKEKGDGIPIHLRIHEVTIGGISAPHAVQVSSNRDQGFANHGNINIPMFLSSSTA
ncbi:hypothetical protein BGW41_001400 [Actinomortierella wolfii]|nr:hypothetical protein BGW41_001400 [Actinomortierella wolfii]